MLPRIASTCLVTLFGLAAVVSAQPIQSPVNGHWYEMVTPVGGLASWPDARDEAAGFIHNGLQGYLATFTSAEEENWVIANFGQIGTDTQIWIGASDEDVEDTWVWVTGEPWGHTNWDMGEPNGSTDENCLQYTDGVPAWNDEGCLSRRPLFLVEYGMDPVPASPFWTLFVLLAILGVGGTWLLHR